MTGDETATSAGAPAGPPAACGRIGEEFDPFHAHGQDPFPFYARARAEAPVFYSPRFGVWFVTRYDDVAVILRDPLTFSSTESLPKPRERAPEVEPILRQARQVKTLINVDPPEHTRLRQVAREGFTPARVAALEPMIREVTEDLIDRMGAGPADLLDRFAYPLPLTVILHVLGVPLEDMERCRGWTRDMTVVDFAPDDLPIETQVAAARGFLAFVGYWDDLVARRAAEPRDDLISHLVTAPVHGEERLAPEHVAAMLPSFILAGHETTANLIGNTVWRLLQHPDQLAAVTRDPALVPGAVEEGLRYDPSTLGFIRTARRQVEIAGTTIPAGGKLFLLYASANHDGARYPAPEAFRVDRNGTTQHLAFGRGIHFCLGAQLARLEARVALERLLARLPGLRLADPAAPPRWRPNLVFRGLERLLVSWDAPR